MGQNQLSPHHQAFCMHYANTGSDTFGNGTRAYLKVYPASSEASARRSASELLTNPDILTVVSETVQSRDLTDEYVDSQLRFLITQNADLSSKLGAIKEYNKLRMRILRKAEDQFLGPMVYIPQKLPTNYE